MKVEIVMPQMGESITEGTIIKWHKKEGDKVKKDEIIYEISTDKVDTEIPSPEDGTLIDIKVLENETVKVGTVVAILETNNDIVSKTGKDEIENIINQDSDDVVDIIMPKMGESITEGTIIKWHKKVGDPVKVDEILLEISTDKVDTEVPSPVDGTITEILFNENDTVEVGVVIAKIKTGGGLKRRKEQEQDDEKGKDFKDEVRNKDILEGNKSVVSSKKFFSPSVINIARREGISISELEMINGSGVGGRVTKNDVMNYLENKKKSKVELLSGETISATKSEITKSDSNTRIEIIPMDNIRQRIVHHMVNSRDTSVHVTSVLEVDMSKIHNFIKQNKELFLQKNGVKLTYLPFISFAAIKALKEYPLMNASIEGNNIIIKKYINLGIAVALEPNGLIVPNIKNADKLNILELAKAISEVGNKARSKKLLPDDIMDGTFSITNYGVFGSLFGTPIINQPEVGILGVGAVTKKPVVIENEGIESIAIKPMMYLSLSHDHRLIDGMLGGKFLMFVKNQLENFNENDF